LLLAVLLAGCTLGPDFQRPASASTTAWAAATQAATSQPVAEPLELRWWDSFHDPA
jgi:outer membrane protein TolC